jgi:outer membrane protein OmpA-like peptidoglycan-associated protein
MLGERHCIGCRGVEVIPTSSHRRPHPSSTAVGRPLLFVVGIAVASCSGNSELGGIRFDAPVDRPEPTAEPVWWERIEVLPAEPVTVTTPPRAASSAEFIPAPRLCLETVRVPSDLLFDSDSSALSDQARRVIRLEVLPELADAISIEVKGHSDTTGDEAYNLALSQQRADAVAQALRDLGVQPQRVTANGYGESAPIVDENTPDPQTARARNRRVDVITQCPCTSITES